MFRQIVHLWMFGPVDLDIALENLIRTDADGIDLSVSFDESHNSLEVLFGSHAGKQLERCGLPVEVVTPLYRAPQLDFSHTDKKVRKTTVAFTNSCVDLAKLYGAAHVLVTPSHISPGWRFHSSGEEDWKRAVDSLSESAEYAEKHEITLMLEPICRYMVSMLHTVADAQRMMEEVASPALGVVLDTFHMNIEEENGILAGIRAAKGRLGCLHLGNNNRKPPSPGTIDWGAILQTLEEIGFDGPLSHEPIELHYSEKRVATDARYRENFIKAIAKSIRYLRQMGQNSESGGKPH